MKRSTWLKPKVEELKLPKMPESSEDDNIVVDKGPEIDIENQFWPEVPNYPETNFSDPVSFFGNPVSNRIDPIEQIQPSITMGFSRVHINGQMLASFPAEQIEEMSPRNNNLGPGSPIYIGEDINPIGFVVSLVSNFDFNHGNALTRQIIASIDRVFIQI